MNHLIRKFSEPLGRENENQVRVSLQVSARGGGNTIRDHAVPVIVLLEELLSSPDTHIEVTHENAKHVDKFLRQSLLIVEVTPEEDMLLSNQGYQRAMPLSWRDKSHQWYSDPLARYKECGIEV